MIGNLTYDQIEEIVRQLENSTLLVKNYIKDKNIVELEDFLSTVEGYSKFLMTTIELNKDADKELQELKNQKKSFH